MEIHLNKVIPNYMEPNEIIGSDIYLKENIDFSSPRKYLIRARSGRGKTSLFSILYGSLNQYSGSVKKTRSGSNTDLWKNHISCVFQDLKLFPELSAMDNVLLKNNLTQHKTKIEIESYFKQLEMSEKMNSLVAELSQGQKQRVAIIRALCQPFDFMLLDEPFSHLDNSNVAVACSLINEELNKQKSGMILMSLEDNDLFQFDQKMSL